MRSTRLLLAASTLCLASTLAACSGGDDEPSADKSASASKSAEAGQQVTRKCTAKVEVTGSVQASWTGKGTSMRMTSGPKAIYRADHGDGEIVLYAAGKDFATTANFTQGNQTFTTQLGDDSGLDIAGSGRKASVEADAVGVDPGANAHLVASFDC